MECVNCPYAKESFERTWADNIEDVTIYCDKVGGKVSLYGYCGDALPCSTEKLSSFANYESVAKKPHRGGLRYKRLQASRYKQHLKELSKVGGYPCPAWYVDEIRSREYGYIPNPKPYYKRYYRGSRSKYLKKISNKKVRRYSKELSNGNYYHRLYDFWWEYI